VSDRGVRCGQTGGMEVVAIIGGVAIIVLAFADLLNTLVSTSTSGSRWWPTSIVGYRLFAVVRGIARRLKEDFWFRNRLMSMFAPLMFLTLLTMWAALQIVGFGLIWWGLDGVEGIESLGDDLYYSGVVFFTVGFGEVLPVDTIPRVGAIIEAFFGVLTIALVIGYLPSLYSAYSERERQLMLLDDGSDDRITPTELVMAWAPTADPADFDEHFDEWERWIASVSETHATLPLLTLFRSHDPRQNWVTALGLVSDAAIHAQIIVGSSGRTSSYWFLRRSIALFEQLTEGIDLSDYARFAPTSAETNENEDFFRELYGRLDEHGFEILPYEEARERARIIRGRWAPQMEYLIDSLLCPRGFWSPKVGLVLPEPSRTTADLVDDA